MEKQVKQVLFSCTLNAIRSVMAEAIFNKIAPESWKSVSCGVIAGPPDGFTFAVMEEKGISLALNRPPKLLADLKGNNKKKKKITKKIEKLGDKILILSLNEIVKIQKNENI